MGKIFGEIETPFQNWKNPLALISRGSEPISTRFIRFAPGI